MNGSQENTWTNTCRCAWPHLQVFRSFTLCLLLFQFPSVPDTKVVKMNSKEAVKSARNKNLEIKWTWRSSNGLVERPWEWVFLSFLEERGIGLSKQKNISSTARTLFLNYLCGPSVCTGRLEMKTEDEVDFKNCTEEVVSTDIVTLPLATLYKEMPLMLWPAGFLSVALAKLNDVQWHCFSLLKIAWAFLTLAFSTTELRHIYGFSTDDRLSQEVPLGARLYQDLCVIWQKPCAGMHLRLVMLCGASSTFQVPALLLPGWSWRVSPSLLVLYVSREFLAEGLCLMLVCAQTLRSKGSLGWGCVCLSWKKNESWEDV